MNVRMIALIGVLATTFAVRSDEPAQRVGNAKPITYELNLGIYQGDPLGDRDAGEITALAEPKLVFQAGHSCNFLMGGSKLVRCSLGGKMVGQVPVDTGFALELVATPGDNAQTNVDFQMSYLDLNANGSVKSSIRMQSNKVVRPSEPIRRKLGVIDGKLTWVEYQIRQVENFPTH